MERSKNLTLDMYEWKARYVPAIIVLTPPILTTWSQFPGLQEIVPTLTTLGVSVPLMYFLALLARIAGKRVESNLFAIWHGVPTTRLLRWADAEIDPITKARYKAALQTAIPCVAFPSVEEEKENPDHANQIYDSAVNWLRSRTRNRNQYPRVFQELVNYGLARNLYGLRPLGLVLSLVSLLVVLFQSTISVVLSKDGVVLQASSTPMSVADWTAIAVSTMVTASLLLFVTRNSIQRIAVSYARALLETCENISPEK